MKRLKLLRESYPELNLDLWFENEHILMSGNATPAYLVGLGFIRLEMIGKYSIYIRSADVPEIRIGSKEATLFIGGRHSNNQFICKSRSSWSREYPEQWRIITRLFGVEELNKNIIVL
jgi:hypothetical protein